MNNLEYCAYQKVEFPSIYTDIIVFKLNKFTRIQ